MTLPHGISIPGFDSLEHVGSGGLGDVFVARRITTSGKVAIKLLRDTEHTDLDRRVRRELEALMELKGHPSVVGVEDVVATSHGPALVMEYVSGGSLHEHLKSGGPLAPAQVRDIGVQVATLLADAHALGIVHRDIKPQNILLTAFGSYKVCDFGIASLARSDDWADQTSSLSYRYASPEEIDGLAVGGAADVFSLGVTLIQARTGETDGARRPGTLPYSPASGPDRQLAETLRLMVDPTASSRPAAAEVTSRLRAIAFVEVADGDDDTTVVRGPPRGPPGTPPVHPTSGGAGPVGQTQGPSQRRLPEPTTQINWWE